MRIAACALMILALIAGMRTARADPPPARRARVEAALSNISTLVRPGQDALATVWDGNKYIQCRRMPDITLRCEAAGAVMQSSLARVLVPERVARLAALGWRLDNSFGNYVQSFPADMPVGEIADRLMQALAEGYDANLAGLEVLTDWIHSEKCPPRNGPSQNLAGMINDSPAMARYALHACRYAPGADDAPDAEIASASELIKLYGGTVTGEVQRLRVNNRRRVFFALETGAGYVQCESSQRSFTARRNRPTAGRRSHAS